MYFRKMLLVFIGALALVFLIAFNKTQPAMASGVCWPGQGAFGDAMDECWDYCWEEYQADCADPLPTYRWCNGDTCVTKWDLVCDGHESEHYWYYTYEENHPDCIT